MKQVKKRIYKYINGSRKCHLIRSAIEFVFHVLMRELNIYSIFCTFSHTDEDDGAFYVPMIRRLFTGQSLQVRRKLFMETIDSMLNFHKQKRCIRSILRRLLENVVSSMIEKRIKEWGILLDKRNALTVGEFCYLDGDVNMIGNVYILLCFWSRTISDCL